MYIVSWDQLHTQIQWHYQTTYGLKEKGKYGNKKLRWADEALLE